MKVHHYDPLTSAYLGSRTAHVSPADGAWLLPAHATFTPPPPEVAGQLAFWDKVKNEWHMLPITNEQATLAVVGWLATPDEKRKLIDEYVTGMYDAHARACNFVNMAEAVAMSTVDEQSMPWAGSVDANIKALAKALAQWRAACAAQAINIKAAAIESNGPMPSAHDILQQMPKFNRPAALTEA